MGISGVLWLKRVNAHSKVLYGILYYISRIGNFRSALLKINLRDQIEVLAVKKIEDNVGA